MNKKLAIFCLVTIWVVQIIPAYGREVTMCDSFRWGTDLQAHFSGYKVAICINGMFPSRMVVYKDSDTTSQVGVRVLPLEEVAHFTKGEFPVTIGKLPNGLFYKAKDGSTMYKLVVTKGRLAEFEIFVGSKSVYRQITDDIIFVDLIPPQ